ncbi:hypothetical protein DFH09DRAFT_1331463 [Mycena vulgaris]|nr:hypothetical protein DFH09DRAFT_1331463 [Mycena vulgaris]
MSFSSVTNAYRLVVSLSLLQITSGVTTISLYGSDGTVSDKVVQLAPAVYAALTILMIYHMLRYTRRADTNILSRAEGQYYFLIFLVAVWGLSAICAWANLVLSEPRAACIPAAFVSARCLSIGADAVLPPAIIFARCVPSHLSPCDSADQFHGTVYSASRALRRCAVAMYGTEMVQPLAAVAPAPLIPAWMAPHVSDLRRAHESTGKAAIPMHVV